jgi:hypothetical protein
MSDLQEQIVACKEEIWRLLSADSLMPERMEAILDRLQRLESAAQDDAARAWYELARLRVRLQREMLPQMPGTADPEARLLRRELFCLWHEAQEVQRRFSDANVSVVTKWLARAEQALATAPALKGQAMHDLLQARFALAKAQQGVSWQGWSYLAIGLELCYLVAVACGLLLYTARTQMAPADLLAGHLLYVPGYVFVWGLLGGISWCLYWASHWSKQRLFDRYYLSWYVAHPWLSALLGGTVALLIGGGLASVGAAPEPTAPTRAALLSLASFFAGFSTNMIWKLLDRSARKLLGAEEKGKLEEVSTAVWQERQRSVARSTAPLPLAE